MKDTFLRLTLYPKRQCGFLVNALISTEMGQTCWRKLSFSSGIDTFFWQLLDVSWYKNCVVQFGIFSLFSYFSSLGPLKDAYSWFSCQFSLCSINFSSSTVTCSLPTTPLIRIGFIGPLLAGRLCGSSNRTHVWFEEHPIHTFWISGSCRHLR